MISKFSKLQITSNQFESHASTFHENQIWYWITWINIPWEPDLIFHVEMFEMRTRFGISSSTCIIFFKPCQICWGNKRISSVTPSYLSDDFGTICRPGTKWGPELISQDRHISLYSNFFRYGGMATKFHQLYYCGGHVTLIQFYRPCTKWGPDIVFQVLHAPLPSNFVR